MPHTHNQILARVSPTDLEDLRRSFHVVSLVHGQVLANAYDHMHKVYFPYSGILSCVVELEDGSIVESGMIGNDGVLGAGQALNKKLSLHKVIVQIPGLAAAVDADHLKAVVQSSPDLLAILIKYEQFFTAQVQQTSACNALHRSLRKITKTRGSFPTDEAALKLLYLAIKNAGLHWRRPVEWTAAMGQFAIHFGARFPGTAR